MDDAPTVFVRNHSNPGSLQQSTQLDVVVFLRNKFAYVTFENDETGTADRLPKGSGAGIAYGTIGRVGGVIAAVEYAGAFDTIDSPPLEPGANAGQIAVRGDTLKVACTCCSCRSFCNTVAAAGIRHAQG